MKQLQLTQTQKVGLAFLSDQRTKFLVAALTELGGSTSEPWLFNEQGQFFFINDEGSTGSNSVDQGSGPGQN